MIAERIDNLIGLFSPATQLRRVHCRQLTEQLKVVNADHQAMRKMLGTSGGYQAGQTNRLTRRIQSSAHENDLPREQINTLRTRSWNLYRNNPQARKIIRTLAAKVIGRGLSPQPQATRDDGSPFVEFRRRAREIWNEVGKELDFRGRPGRGGQSLVTLHKTALRQIILSGGILVRFRGLSRRQQRARNLLMPLQVQLIHTDRLDESVYDGKTKFYGLEVDQDGRPLTYHLLEGGDSTRSIPVPADEMTHLFAEEDVDQLLGTPWLGAALLTMDDRREYEASELTAAHFGSCFVGGYKRSAGQKQFGLPNPSGNKAITDAEGQAITHLQPGLFVDLGTDGDLQLLNPNRPNSGAEAFLAYLLRSEAVAVPGVKSSTLTGDYRNSSFSSERSADNDAWPELEELQDWFSSGFSQPIYEEVIKTAVSSGLFDDVDGFNATGFADRRRDYLKANWQGPVARSINPKDDAAAARSRVQNGTSSPQREAAQIGRDWREVLQEVAEFIEYANELNVPADIWQQALGIEQTDAGAEPTETNETDDEEQQSHKFAAIAGAV